MQAIPHPNNLIVYEPELKESEFFHSRVVNDLAQFKAAVFGVSLGKINFCLKALLDKGLLKIQNFQNSKRKLAYAYP